MFGKWVLVLFIATTNGKVQDRAYERASVVGFTWGLRLTI